MCFLNAACLPEPPIFTNCCPEIKIVLKNGAHDQQGEYAGEYKIIDGQSINDQEFWISTNARNHIWWTKFGQQYLWMVGTIDHWGKDWDVIESPPGGIASSTALCPEKVTDWKYKHGNTWLDGESDIKFVCLKGIYFLLIK